MYEFLLALLIGTIIALIVNQVLVFISRDEQQQPLIITMSHALKELYAKLVFTWKLHRKKRLLDIHDLQSRDPIKMGLVASELEKLWENAQQLTSQKSLDMLSFYGLDDGGTYIIISISRLLNRIAIVSMSLILPDGTTYQIPENLVCNTDGRYGYNAGGVKLQLLEPMRRWRITFNGFVKRVHNGKEEDVILRINLLWTSFSRPFEFKREFSNNLMARNLAREAWGSLTPPTPYCNHTYDGIDQWGAFFGTFYDSSRGEEKEIYLRGLRQKRWGELDQSQFKQSMEVIGSDKEGNYFYMVAKNESPTFSNEVWGHFYHSSGTIRAVDECNADLKQLPLEYPKHAVYRFTVAGRNYQAIMSRLPIELFESIDAACQIHSSIYPGELTFNSFPGRVMLIIRNQSENSKRQTPSTSLPYLCGPKRAPTKADNEKLVLMFNQEACKFESLVGGKGSSLALLSTLADTDQPVGFTVPKGFCVTVQAWKIQTQGNREIQSAIERVEKVAHDTAKTHLEEACQKATSVLTSHPVDVNIQNCIRASLEELCGPDIEKKPFAVRSSAVGEDGETLSSAGQNETVLGCRGFKSIIRALQKCWASLLTYQSVEYRRQHGEQIVPGMGVVIQEMVNAEAAGVLFTVNPNDGDPSKMILTANFGLGESVVSASADPDTIILNRTYTSEVTIGERTVGAKHSKIVLVDDGTTEQELDQEQSATQCLADGTILRLGHLGLYLEKIFGGPRDLEFAVAKGIIFLLQARPVTSLDYWTDFELQHEFDTPLISNNEYMTKANTGEVLPGSGTPLSISFSQRSMDLNLQVMSECSSGTHEVNPWCMGRFTALFCNQAFLNVVDMFRRDIDEKPSDNDRSVDMAVFGRLITNEAMHKMGLRRFGAAGLVRKFNRFRSIFTDLFFNEKRIRKVEPIYTNYSFPVEHYTKASELYQEITKRMPIIFDIGEAHMVVSRASGTAQMIAFIIMLDGSNEWTTELYGEIAQLLTSISNVESADVPVALKKLAKAIADDEESQQKFVEASVEDALEWLKANNRKAGELYRSFIKRHGHRGVKEFDLMTEVWELNPKGLVSVLQSMVANQSSYQDPATSGNDWQKSLPPMKTSKLWALKFFVPKSRAAVVAREKTKSMLIRTIHVFRTAYRRLAELLVQEGKLPDANLIFFLTHSEIGDLVETTGTGLVSKAKRRRKLFPLMNDLTFPEISHGIPIPVINDVNLHIQPGDILITRSTDIGWSPYFPLLSGVVTELGGLISHGAVVAREYGLPAIVGCANATQVFKSGDMVLLDGTKGTITRLSEAKMDVMD